MKVYLPKTVLIEKDALQYELGQRLKQYFENNNVNIRILNSNRVTGLPSEKKDRYMEGKQTLVIAVRKTFKFQSCKPSAHYQLPLVTGCIGQCEYCYLNTQFGDKPYITVYVNVEDVLKQTKKYIDERDEITIFEGAATSDPLPMEDLTHSLKESIEFFASEPKGRFRFVTKYNNVDSLLNIDHNDHTTIRFSINSDRVIKEYEHKTPSLDKRLEASAKVIAAGYPSGFIIAPVFMEGQWKDDYSILLDKLESHLCDINMKHELTFEVISHRFTTRAKNVINEVFEGTTLPMNEEDRKFKYGQFGYGKYVYEKDKMEEMKEFFTQRINKMSFANKILYTI